jgi:hypothetical protein
MVNLFDALKRGVNRCPVQYRPPHVSNALQRAGRRMYIKNAHAALSREL